jgi:Uma2 family endonuclease
MVEPELHLGSRPDILVPDLAGWREERYPHDLDDDVPYLTLAPDWVCEVLSESTSRVDRMKKVPIYAREGVVHVWLADPRARTVEVYQLGEARYELVGTWGGDEEPYVMPPFDAVSLSAASIWGRRIRR